MTGTRVGNWIVQQDQSRSDGGTVYRVAAVEPREGEPAEAALTMIELGTVRDPDAQTRFAAEMLPLRRLTHPNIARYLDAGTHAGMLFHTREFFAGVDLKSRLSALKPGEGLDWSTVVHPIAVQVARALKHAHHRSILHRDLKPSHVLVNEATQVKVLDFGVAKVLNLPPLSLPAEPFGTACYLAPEYFTGKPPTRKSDLYSYGGLLYTLVTGRPPFVAATAAEYLHKHCYMLPDRPINFVPKLAPDVDEFICALLQKDPARRPASAAAVLEELDRLSVRLERQGQRVTPPPEAVDPTGLHAPLPAIASAEPAPGKDDRRRRDALLRGGILVTLLGLVIGVILFAFFRPRPSADELWQQAQPLLNSDNPADWDVAKDDLFAKLERWHPDAYAAEMDAARQKLRDRRDLRRAIEAGAGITIRSDAERRYRTGLAFATVGDAAAARENWQRVVDEYAEDKRHGHWVTLAELGLKQLAAPPSR
jgi:eukaryotic-like serine/threonine-protein kinase